MPWFLATIKTTSVHFCLRFGVIAILKVGSGHDSTLGPPPHSGMFCCFGYGRIPQLIDSESKVNGASFAEIVYKELPRANCVKSSQIKINTSVENDWTVEELTASERHSYNIKDQDIRDRDPKAEGKYLGCDDRHVACDIEKFQNEQDQDSIQTSSEISEDNHDTDHTDDTDDSENMLHLQHDDTAYHCRPVHGLLAHTGCSEHQRNRGPSEWLDPADWVLACQPSLSQLTSQRNRSHHYTVHRLTIVHYEKLDKASRNYQRSFIRDDDVNGAAKFYSATRF